MDRFGFDNFLRTKMAHFAQLDKDNIVLQVIVVSNSDTSDENGIEREELGVAFCQSLLGDNTVWKQTSYNRRIRKNYAGIGYRYDEVRDAFIPPKPYYSWVLNEETATWEPPVPKPSDGKLYNWDELMASWVEVKNV